MEFHEGSDRERNPKYQAASIASDAKTQTYSDYSFNSLNWDLRSDSAIENNSFPYVQVSEQCFFVVKREVDNRAKHTITITLSSTNSAKKVEPDVIDLTED